MTEKELGLQRNKQELSQEGGSGWPEMGTCLLNEKSTIGRRERGRKGEWKISSHSKRACMRTSNSIIWLKMKQAALKNCECEVVRLSPHWMLREFIYQLEVRLLEGAFRDMILCDVVIIAVILLISQQIEYLKDMTVHNRLPCSYKWTPPLITMSFVFFF